MNKIEKLISELCPNGVEFFSVSELCDISRGRVMSKWYLADNKWDYPVYSSQTVNDWMIGKIKTYDYDWEFLTWTTDWANAWTIFYRVWKFSITNVCWLLKPKEEELNIKFLYYILWTIAKSYVSAGMWNPKLMSNAMWKIKIPFPDIKIQEEIVKILDNFTLLEAELEAELEARKKQYEYYRDEILNIDNIQYVELREVWEMIRGNWLQKKDFTDEGIWCIHYGQIYTYYWTNADKTKTFVWLELAKKLKKAQKWDVLIAWVSENIEDVCKPLAWLGDEICISWDMFAFRHNQNTKFITYLLQTTSFYKHKRKYAHGAKVTRVKLDKILDYKIPLISLEKQEEIVNILDKFDKLVNDISDGLPAEIEARRQQYEYYRNKLLTFKELEK